MRTKNINGLTYDEWLAQAESLPEGFTENLPIVWGHWNQGDSIGWAIFCFTSKKHSRSSTSRT